MTYWERAARRRVSRRWVLGAASATAGAASLSFAGCSFGDSKTGTPTVAAPDLPDATESAVASATAPITTRRGETLRYTGYVSTGDDPEDRKWDPHKTQAGPLYGQQSLVFSRLLSYVSQTKGSITGDLSLALPEQADATTLVFRLNPNAHWDDRSPLNGRQVTAADVKYSIERQTQGDTSFVRRSQWANVDKIDTPDPAIVRITTKTPLATMVNAFADVNSLIVAPELTAQGRRFGADSQMGSGPFRWVEWQEGKFASVARNAAWFGGDGRPFLDGVTLTQPANTAEIEANLRTKKLDVAFVSRPQADRLKKARPELQESTVGQLLFFGMRFYLKQAPYNDLRFRSAISLAIDRREMVQKWFAGSGDVNPWVSWPLQRWTLPQTELITMPGYRTGDAGRAADIKDARAQLAAFAGEKAVPADNALFVDADAEKNLGMGSLIKTQLKAALDLNVTIYPVKTADLIRRVFAEEAPWIAGPDSSRIDLDDCLYPYFHSEGTQNTFPLRDKDMDAAIAAQRAELNEDKRRQIGYDIQRKLAGMNLGLNFCSERVVALSWPYVRNFPLDGTDGYQHRFADCWIDRNDPTYRDR